MFLPFFCYLKRSEGSWVIVIGSSWCFLPHLKKMHQNRSILTLFQLSLSYFVRCKNGLKQALINDLSNPQILRQLRILGLLGKVFTGPWMVQFYGNKLHLKHLEMIPLMKDCINYLETLIDEPSLILKGMTSRCLQAMVHGDFSSYSCQMCRLLFWDSMYSAVTRIVNVVISLAYSSRCAVYFKMCRQCCMI